MAFGVFERDLLELSASALRQKYKLEASSHRNMLRRVKEDGLELDPRWQDFRSFLSDMRPKPSPEHTLDRIDGSKLAYGPGLCRWASKLEQTQNRKNTISVVFDGSSLTVAEFADRIGKPYPTVYGALRRGEKPEEIATKSQRSPQRYCPKRYEGDPAGLATWYEKYARWLKDIKQPDRKRFGLPQIFDIVGVSRAYAGAEAYLERKGLYELAPTDDAGREALLGSRPGEIYRNAFEWIDYAVDALEREWPKLAAKFERRVGWTYPDFQRFGEWLHEPPTDATFATKRTTNW